MFILGLTGSIGMGKTTAAKAFRFFGVPTYDADAAVHQLTGSGGRAVASVEAAFPGVVKNGAVDRMALGKKVFDDSDAIKKLEAILHPLVRKAQFHFLKQAAKRKEKLVVLDIPLLFETGGFEFCDAVAVVSAPAFLQRIRVLPRHGMTPDKLVAILNKQIPDIEKRRRADFIILTGLGRGFSLRCIGEIVKVASQFSGKKWPLRNY